MRSIVRATSLALVLTVVASAAQAQSGVKVAYINSQALMDAAPGRAEAEAQLQKMGEGFRAQLKKLQDSAQARLTAYQKEEPKASPAAKEKAQKELQALEDTLQSKQQTFQQQYQAKQNELLAPITDLVKKVIDDIRREDGYAMILDNAPGASVIVSADKNLDITDRVVSRLRATSPAKAKSQETTATKGAPPAPAGVTRPIKPPTR
jgi:outer membrane protein